MFGNVVFADTGVSIIGHQKCSDTIHVKSEKLLAQYKKSGTVRASSRCHDRLSKYRLPRWSDIPLGQGFLTDIIHPGVRAHTDSDSMFRLLQEGVVFAGDILWVGYHPNLEHADIKSRYEL